MDNMSKTKQLTYWENDFGNEYIKRNSDLAFFKRRRPFFAKLLNKYTEIRSVLEVGPNIGGNLFVLQQIDPHLRLFGLEPNHAAIAKARSLVPTSTFIESSVFNLRKKVNYDLVFTAGVLIHIANQDLENALRAMYRVSSKYLLTVEYYSEKRQTVHYRGLTDALFKRPYDQEWLRVYPRLTLLEQGFLGKYEGFDDCNYFLLRKNG